MGTNYYLVTNYCEACHRGDKEHIGKSSAGWTFSFQATVDVDNKDAWFARLENEIAKGAHIEDEHGCWVTVDDMIMLIHNKRNSPRNHAKEYREQSWLDKDGNSFTIVDFS